MIRALIDLWRARQRRYDVEHLWPIIKEQAEGDLARARIAFHIHAVMDPAWLALGEAEIARRMEHLM